MEMANNVRIKMGRSVLAALLTGVIGISLAACGGDASAGSGTSNTGSNAAPATTTQPTANTGSTDPAETPAGGGTADGSASAQEVKVDLKEWAVDLSEKELKAGKV